VRYAEEGTDVAGAAERLHEVATKLPFRPVSGRWGSSSRC
jgi:hypothetical protein